MSSGKVLVLKMACSLTHATNMLGQQRSFRWISQCPSRLFSQRFSKPAFLSIITPCRKVSVISNPRNDPESNGDDSTSPNTIGRGRNNQRLRRSSEDDGEADFTINALRLEGRGRKRRGDVSTDASSSLTARERVMQMEAELEEEEVEVEDRRQVRDRAKKRVENLLEEIPEDSIMADSGRSEVQQKDSDDWYLGSTFNNPEGVEKPTENAVNEGETAEEGEEEKEEVEDGILTVGEVVNMLETERGRNLAVLDVSGKCDWTETMIIVEGRSKKQLFALVDGVRRMAKKFAATDSTVPGSLVIEGANCDDWMVLDLGRVVIHAMTPEARAQYDIEGLWTSLPESEHNFKGDDVEEEEKMLETKQLEVEDMMDEEEMVARMRSGEVAGRKKRN
ncbi:hypothetical protein BC829DRAFT_439570 [Chytridium lagenaria]|nr:hypothetical protein BC829DRAFT_439570 [Chytridium lagenaria]